MDDNLYSEPFFNLRILIWLLDSQMKVRNSSSLGKTRWLLFLWNLLLLLLSMTILYWGTCLDFSCSTQDLFYHFLRLVISSASFVFDRLSWACWGSLVILSVCFCPAFLGESFLTVGKNGRRGLFVMGRLSSILQCGRGATTRGKLGDWNVSDDNLISICSVE